MRYRYNCNDEQVEKWIQCTVCPYLIGLLLFLYCPFVLCNTKLRTDIQRQTEEENERTCLLNVTTSISDVNDGDLISEEPEWVEDFVYVDGRYPVTFFSVFANMLSNQHLVAVSRLKRIVLVILCSTVLIIQITYYHIKMSDEVKEMIAHDVPVGFLALLGETSSGRKTTFVPIFGGPVTILVTYYLFGSLFVVLPSSLEDTIEKGLSYGKSNRSPLLLNPKDIKRFANIEVFDDNGYSRAANFLLCRFYTLFNGAFWKSAIQIQWERFRYASSKWLSVTLVPVYFSCCVIELTLCALLYSVPVFGFVAILIRGVLVKLNIILGERIIPLENTFRQRLIISLLYTVVTAVLLFYCYSTCLVFLQSFLFVSQVIMYCYIAIVIFPTASFGYLFFVIVLVYYIFRLIRGFGANYLELLCDTVEIISRTEEQDAYLSVPDKSVLISDFRIKDIKTVVISNVKIPVPLESQHRLLCRRRNTRENILIYRHNTYGIRRDLFDYVVKRHLPVHQQALKVILHLVVIFCFLLITISLTTSFCRGPVSEMSDVMHVVFVVIVGALPRVMEVVLRESSEHVYREIVLRRIEGTVNDFFQTVVAHGSHVSHESEQHIRQRSGFNPIN